MHFVSKAGVQTSTLSQSVKQGRAPDGKSTQEPYHTSRDFNYVYTVAPWPHKDIKLVTLKISIDPSHIWSTDSKTVLR